MIKLRIKKSVGLVIILHICVFIGKAGHMALKNYWTVHICSNWHFIVLHCYPVLASKGFDPSN
jgi:hypothetical protein